MSRWPAESRPAGWVYVWAMATVAVTAVFVSGWRVLFDPPRRTAAPRVTSRP